MPKKIDQSSAARAVRLVNEHQGEYSSLTAAAEVVAKQFGVGKESVRALMESINGLYKTECIRTTVFHDGPYKTLADVEYATAGWVDLVTICG